ncbi:hypothetical protein L6164_033427 [Bauhinia variegata]|uniref:Uncharacterized protein n=1 Tax=Bauhinia variegata TaxID=167791 RepID=A0ACB9KRQ4_BAUVA|nr:hypothetical protein L6164_033427 [Bauhinia variegata]
MASLKQALMLFFPLLACSSTVSSNSEDAGIAVYWGQNLEEGVKEGTLQETCQSGSYKYVTLASLTVFGCNRTPSWDFDSHCSGWDCLTELAPEVEFCQNQDILVFLSIGGMDDYSLCSPEDAKEVANFLWQVFLSGQQIPDHGQGLALNGIVFDIEGKRSNLYYDNLVTELNAFRTQKQFYLTAATGCIIPDYLLDKAIRTGYFDFISVKLYENSTCQFDGSANNLLNAWDIWTRYVPSNAKVFLGITTNPSDNGYIPPEILISILHYLKLSPNYAGIDAWNRYWDVQTNPSYSDQVLPYVSKNVLRYVTEKSWL